jgi:hypothetical protein
MTDEKKSAAAAALAKYGEKVALGVSVLALGVGAFLMFGLKSPDPTAAVRHIGAKVKNGFSEEHEAHKAPAPENWQARSVGDWNTVLVSARAGNDWVATLATTAEGKALDKKITKAKLYKVPSVIMGQVDVEIDHIMVNWSVLDFTREEKRKDAKDFDFGALTHVQLERQSKGKWEILEPKIDIKTLSYRDSKIEPRTSYTYRLTAFSTEKGFLERGTPDETYGATPNAQGIANQAVSPQVQTYGLWKLGFSNPFKPAEGKGKVYVTIEKFEKGVGKVQIRHIHDEGDVLGFWEEAPGAGPTSIHKISVPPGRVLQVDWNTGATLMKVQPTKVTVDVEKCRPKISAQGNEGCDRIVEKRTVTTNLIVYKDADGEHKMYSPALPDTNERCEQHGGRPKPAPRVKDPANPDAPAVDPKEAARLKKEAEAQALYEKADEALEKQNFPLAKSYYEKLLKDFKTTDFVAKEKQSVIEERLAALKSQK